MSVALLHFIHSPQYHFSQMIGKKNTLYSFLRLSCSLLNTPPSSPIQEQSQAYGNDWVEKINVEKNESSNWSAKKIPR